VHHIAPDSGSSLCIPLIAQGMNLRVRTWVWMRPRQHTGKSPRFATSVTEQSVYQPGQSASLRESLEAANQVRDPLTGLYNLPLS